MVILTVQWFGGLGTGLGSLGSMGEGPMPGLRVAQRGPGGGGWRAEWVDQPLPPPPIYPFLQGSGVTTLTINTISPNQEIII